jgi:hypothetical protein
MADVKINKPTDIIERNIVLAGISDIMFDRYPGDNSTKLEPWQKLYFQAESRIIGIPKLNIMSFLSAHNTNSAPKRLRDKRKYKDIANACLSYTDINPNFIPLMRNGSPIRFGKLINDVDSESGCYIHYAIARLEKGIPNPKQRPVIPLPWSLQMQFTIYPNREIKEQEIINLFDEGGRALGLGTFRGIFGKFRIETWD